MTSGYIRVHFSSYCAYKRIETIFFALFCQADLNFKSIDLFLALTLSEINLFWEKMHIIQHLSYVDVLRLGHVTAS